MPATTASSATTSDATGAKAWQHGVVTAAQLAAEVRAALPQVEVPVRLDNAQVTGQFQQFNNAPEGVRAPHALKALAESDAVEAFAVASGGYTRVLATKRIAVDRPYTVVLDAGQAEGQPLLLDGAWRVYNARPDTSPLDLFTELIERHGFTVTSIGYESKLIARISIPAHMLEQQPAFAVPDVPAGSEIQTNQVMKLDDQGNAELIFVYAIDVTGYRAAVRAERG